MNDMFREIYSPMMERLILDANVFGTSEAWVSLEPRTVTDVDVTDRIVTVSSPTSGLNTITSNAGNLFGIDPVEWHVWRRDGNPYDRVVPIIGKERKLELPKGRFKGVSYD